MGGLVAGLGLTYWVPAAAGSGIPQVKTAYTFRAGAVTMKETVGKFVLCTLQLGSGASLGVEGPTVQICAGVSSFLARMARLSPVNQKRMTSVGMAAGIAAAFNAPIAAVTFTLEELIGSLDQTMLSGVIVAAALAAVVEHTILGSNPIFFVPRLETYTLTKSSSLVWYALLGLLAAIVSVAFTDSLLWLRKWFRELSSVPSWIRPAIGGAATGSFAVVALLFFHLNGIAGNPYPTLTLALLGGLPVTAMAALCVLKLAATVTSYSSGGSGGIFAPALFMGGMLGGAVGYLDVTRLPSLGRFHRRLCRGGHGRGLCGDCARAHDLDPHHLRDDGRLRAGAAADDRQHERVCAGAPLAAHAGVRGAAGAGRHFSGSAPQAARDAHIASAGVERKGSRSAAAASAVETRLKKIAGQ